MKKFARICSYTDQPINEGFYIGEEYYFDENGNLIGQSN